MKCEPSPEKELLRLEEDLLAFQSRLPGHERYSQKTLSLRAFSPRLARFVMTHTWWHVCHCQLYRCLLPTIPETFSQRLFNIFGETAVAGYQNKCLEHAISAVSILTSFLELERDPCTFDMDMAECAFKIAEILLLSSESTRAQMGIGHAEILHHATGCLRFAESMLEMYPAIAPLVRFPFLLSRQKIASAHYSCKDIRYDERSTSLCTGRAMLHCFTHGGNLTQASHFQA